MTESTFPRGEAFAEDEFEWDQDRGMPGAGLVAQAIQVFTMFNFGKLGRNMTVREVGDAFNLDDAQVRQAVAAHYWMFLSGPDDDPTKQEIEHEGE